MLVLVGYITGKLTGLIHSPEWVNLLPLITIVFLIGAAYQKIVGFSDSMNKRTNYLKNSLDKISDKLIEHDKRIYFLENLKKK